MGYLSPPWPSARCDTTGVIYLDHAATAPPDPAVIEAMLPYLTGPQGNPSEPHALGRAARAALDDARGRIAAQVGVDADGVIVTGGGTEADNLAVLGRTTGAPGRLVISAIEHPAVRRAAEARAAEGWEVAIAPVDRSGRVALGPLRVLLRERDAVCCVIGANNVTGVVQPIEPIADLCAARGVPLHVDHVQTAAGAPLDIGQLPGEVTAAIAAHKLGGPRGVGALLGPGVGSLAPVVHGGGQERGLRPGTEDVAGAIALATALERRQGLGAPAEWGARAALRDRLETALSLPVAGADGERLPGHSLLLTGLRGDTLVRLLDERGIAVAAGSACASGATEPDPVLTAMGVDDRTARTAVRVSLGPETTTADVDALIEAWREIAPALQAAVEASA